jgi:hypothetical protein
MSAPSKYSRRIGRKQRYRSDRGMGNKGQEHYERASGEARRITGDSLIALEARLARIERGEP